VEKIKKRKEKEGRQKMKDRKSR